MHPARNVRYVRVVQEVIDVRAAARGVDRLHIDDDEDARHREMCRRARGSGQPAPHRADQPRCLGRVAGKVAKFLNGVEIVGKGVGPHRFRPNA